MQFASPQDPSLLLDTILAGVACLLITSAVAVFIGHKRGASAVIYGLTLVLTSISAFCGFVQLINGANPVTPSLILPIGLPELHAHFRLDMLSTFFFVIVNSLAAAASLYAIQYGSHEKEPIRTLPFYPLFIAGMSLVTIADDAFVFLIAWEMMSVASWLLVLSSHEDAESHRAAYVYIIMACIGTFALTVTFGILGGATGDYSFDYMRAHPLPEGLATLVLFMALIGAGAKAGLVPMHAWLPLAHPAAPTHVSALMSGVMTKVAVYGLIRILFELDGPPAWWWGGIIFLLGGLTAVTGILYALMQTDIKRMLAYSTVENIGIITIGLGLAMMLSANGAPTLAALALTASLFHILNHSLFKSLLFFGAGSVLLSTRTRDMERQGGLIHQMPMTAFVFLIGAMSISALPPFNGFISEWLTFQSILSAVVLPQWLLKFSLPIVAGMLALAATLTAVCFVKAYGIVFLGRARSEQATTAREAGKLMLSAMGVLAVLCAAIGFFPGPVINLLQPIVGDVIPRAGSVSIQSWKIVRPFGDSGSSYSAITIILAIAFMTSFLVFFIHQFASRKVTRGDAWDCGFPSNILNSQYTASSFSQPIRRVFGTAFFGAKEIITMPKPGDVGPATLKVSMSDYVWNWFYAPAADAVNALSKLLDRFQFFTIRTYLSFMFGALVVLLVLVAVNQ